MLPAMPEDDASIETRIDGIDDGVGRRDVEAGSPNLAVDEVGRRDVEAGSPNLAVDEVEAEGGVARGALSARGSISARGAISASASKSERSAGLSTSAEVAPY